MKRRVNIIHKEGNWFEIIDELQVTLKRKNIENFIKKSALAATVYHIWNERNKRLFGKEFNSIELVFHRIMEDVRLKLVGLKYGYLGLNAEICKHWNIPIKNVNGPDGD